jgi:hypothetical protein
VQRWDRYKIRSIYPLFPRSTEKIHDNPQDRCLLGRGLNSVTPEFKAAVSIIPEQREESFMSCVLPTFRRTIPLNNITLYQPYKRCSSSLTVLHVYSESRT